MHPTGRHRYPIQRGDPHTVDGAHAPLETHYVHRSAAGRLAVIGVLFEVGAHEPMFDPIISALPSGPGESRHLEDLDLDADEFHPLAARYYRYKGSLTTPPCSEDVDWIVMAEYRQISATQLEALASHLHKNNRPVQPLGDRELQLISK